MARPEIEVGRSLRELASEAGEAWKAAAEGRGSGARVGTYFRDRSAFDAVLTPTRFDLLRHLTRERAPSVQALARALGRGVGGVREDVVMLAEIGLLTRAEDGSLSSDVDAIRSTTHASSPAMPLRDEVPSGVRDLAERSVDQARRAFDGLMAVTNSAAGRSETSDAAGRTETVRSTAIGFAAANIRSAFELASKLVRAKDLEEVMALQTEYAKAQTTTMREQARELGQAVETTARTLAHAMSDHAGRHRGGEDLGRD